jgi:hypothetical protein
MLPAERRPIADDSDQAYLLRIYYLVKHDRNAEAYQLGIAAVKVYPHSPSLRLATAVAAVNVQRCGLARPHLDRIARLTTDPVVISRRDQLRLACDGAWRRSVDLSLMIGYRPSIMGRPRQRIIHAEPGSDLYRLCAALKGLCNPDRPFLMPGQRDSGVDMWLQATLNHRWRPDSKWQANLSPILFRRDASRGGFQGSGVVLRSQVAYHMSNNLAAYMTLEAGSSSFGRGRGVQPVRQLHKSGLAGLRGRPLVTAVARHDCRCFSPQAAPWHKSLQHPAGRNASGIRCCAARRACDWQFTGAPENKDDRASDIGSLGYAHVGRFNQA